MFRYKNISKFGLGAILTVFLSDVLAGAPIQPLVLRVVRDATLPRALSLSQCITGKLYHGSLSQSDLGSFVCRTLELPYRSNSGQISAIALGTYFGVVRTDGELGWRIELQKTTPRMSIEIHAGNRPSETEGCILVGTTLGGPKSITDAPGCWVNQSRDAMKEIRDIFGENMSRPIQILVQ